MSVALIRPPVVYGPRDRALLLAFRAARLGILPVYDRGLNQISLIHVTDCADAIVRTALAEGPSGPLYTVSDGGIYTWRDLIGVYQKVTGKRVKVLPVPPIVYETAGYAVAYVAFQAARALNRPPTLSPKEIDHLRLRRWVCDYEAIARDLDWKPLIGIEEGMAGTLRWYSDHGWL